MVWEDAKKCKPKQGDRVLLKIRWEDCPVVGYWGCGEFEVCTVNMETNCGAWCNGGTPDKNFKSEEVSHWATIENIPSDTESNNQ